MDYALYLVVLCLVAVLERLPLGFVFRLGGLLGLAAWAILPQYRALARRNLRIALGPETDEALIRRLVRDHFRNLGSNLLSVPRLARMPEEEVQARVEMVGFDQLRGALDRKKGVVMAINHIGNWELYAQLIGRVRDVRVGTVFQSQRNKYLNRLIDRNRRRLGLETFDRRKGYVGAADLIEGGGILAVLIDQHAGEGGIWTPLFGKLASTSPLAAILSDRTGAPLISVAIHTTGPARWRCTIEPPIEPQGRTVAELTGDLNRVLERQISASAKDWFWLHNRWKTPWPRFLGRKWKRGYHFPPGLEAEKLDPFRLVIRSSNWLGDAVMGIPAVEACRAGRPDARITILAPEKIAPLWRRVAAVDEVIGIRPGESPRGLARRVDASFDAAILLPNSPRSALEVRALGVPRIVGYPGRWRSWLLHQTPRFAPASGGHQANRFLRLAEFCGAPVPPEGPVFRRRAPQTGSKPRVGVCPGAEYGPAKRWPAERFAAAMQEVQRSEACQWVIFGVAGDAPAAAAIAAKCDFPVRNLAGKTSLDELMDELSACDALLTNDTGTMHLAAFLGVPTVAVFGSTEPAMTAPLGDFHRVLRRKVECSPCFRRECPIDFRCMTRIEPSEAAAALREILGLSV
ncbi:MAG: lipopolysaccharide heptosyltransferase II [Chthoniobacterales bacterium]